MRHLVLSGVGGSSNWVPLLFPLFGIVILYYGIDYLVKFVKKRRLSRGSKPDADAFENATKEQPLS
jgi:hypothetical protein